MTQSQLEKLVELREKGKTWVELSSLFKGYTANALRKSYARFKEKPSVKVLFLDIETAPMIAHIWGLWDQNVGLNQIEKHSAILSWSAKWAHSDQIIYKDNRKSKDLDNDAPILEDLWNLIDEADILIGHNIKRFDKKKINTSFVKREMHKPAETRIIDTLEIVRENFDAPSNKLEFWAEFLGCKLKKLKHAKYQGHSLWMECLKGNIDAWNEMELYNKNDVLVLEELFEKLKKWHNKINYNVYNDSEENMCSCGSKSFRKHPKYHYTNTGKFERFICNKCGKEYKGRTNLLSLAKRKAMLK